jgi:hypothetical protein
VTIPKLVSNETVHQTTPLLPRGYISRKLSLSGLGAQEQEQGAVGQVDASAVAMVECRDVDLAACGAETVREHAGHLR